MGCDAAGAGSSGQSYCSGNGRCLPMFELANFAVNDNFDSMDITYGLDPNNGLTWDSHRVFGCLCDEGFEGS